MLARMKHHFPRQTTWPRDRRRGFTIVEVAVAAGVMILAIASSILVVQSGFRSLDTARKTTLAAQIIQSEVERIRMLSFSSVQSKQGTSTIELEDIFPQNTDLERQVLAEMKKVFITRTRSITPLTAYSSEVFDITVTVSWKGLDGVTRTRSSSTRYSKGGLYAYYYTTNG